MCLCAAGSLSPLFSISPHFLSLPVTQAVHHCPPTKSRTISPSASHLLPTPFSSFRLFPSLLWQSTILHPLHLSHLIAPLFPSVPSPCSSFCSCFPRPALQDLSNCWSLFLKIFFFFPLFDLHLFLPLSFSNTGFGLILCYSSSVCPLCVLSLSFTSIFTL